MNHIIENLDKMVVKVRMKSSWMLIVIYIASQTTADDPPIEDYACLNTQLSLKCPAEQILVFDWASFGRNSSAVARACRTRYDSNCAFDVHSFISRQCAGKNTCLLFVNEQTFNDPCGSEEFLRVAYRCVTVSREDCSGVNERYLEGSGYIASPNYPDRYFRGATCRWALTVQPTQTIRFSVFDFELDVKRGSTCKDYVDISSGDQQYWHECSRQGRQDVAVDRHTAQVTFRSDPRSVLERGFILHYQAVGPACDPIPSVAHGSVAHAIVNDKFTATVTCDHGFRLDDANNRRQTIHCTGTAWNQSIPVCMAVFAPTVRVGTFSSTQRTGVAATGDNQSPPTIGLVLGLMGALVMITILIGVLFYCYRKQKRLKRNAEKSRNIQNNLLEDSDDMADANLNLGRDPYASTPYSSIPTGEPTYGSVIKQKKKNKDPYDFDRGVNRKLMEDLDDVDIRPYMDNKEIPMKTFKNYTKDSPKKKKGKASKKDIPNKKDLKEKTNSFIEESHHNTAPVALCSMSEAPNRLDRRCDSLRGSRSGLPGTTFRNVSESPRSRRNSLSKRRKSLTLSNSAPDLMADELYAEPDEEYLPRVPQTPQVEYHQAEYHPQAPQIVVVGLPPVPPRQQTFRRNNSLGYPKPSNTAAGKVMTLPSSGYSTQI